jgi:hypothetical protein
MPIQTSNAVDKVAAKTPLAKDVISGSSEGGC